jgi:glycine dehydrogenase
MASMYGVYHGPRGLKNIASRIHLMTKATADTLIRYIYIYISDTNNTNII